MKTTLLDNERVFIEIEDGILVVTSKDVLMTLNSVQEGIKYRLEAVNGKPYPLLSNVKAMRQVSKEARVFLASEKGCEGVIAAAVLIESAVGRIIANFFIRIDKPLVPTKVFTDEAEAKKWLAKYVKSLD